MHPRRSDIDPIGRDHELAVLRAAVRALSGGRGGVVWLDGEPGIGKSTLLTAVAAMAAREHFDVYRAAGDPLAQRLPLRALLDALDPTTADIATLLPGHRGDGGGNAAVGADVVPAALDRLVAVVERRGAAVPVVVTFDDLQWADEASLLAWHRLGLATGRIPLLLVGACRPVPVRPTVTEVRRAASDRGGVVIELGPLGAGDVAGLAARLAGAPPGPRLRRAVAPAGGNPLYARELVDALARARRIRVDGGVAELTGAADQAPPALAGAIAGRLGFLSPEATRALRLAALLGPEFSVSDLVTVAGTEASTLLPVLDEAIAAGVLAETGDRLRFRHGLIRQALYELTPATARSALHRQVARALDGAGLPVDRVAGHLLAAPDAIDGWALDWLAAHAAALAHRAPDIAADLLAVAERRCPADDPRRAAALRGLALALYRLSRLDEAEAVARHAQAAAADPDHAAELAWVLGSILFRTGRTLAALAVLDDHLGRPWTSRFWQARLRALRAKALPLAGRRAEGGAEALRALAEGERLPDRLTIGHALQALYLLSDHATGVAHLDRALAVLGDLPEARDLRIAVLTNHAYSLHALGRPGPAQESMREALELAEHGGTGRLPTVRVQTAAQDIETGRWDDAWAGLGPLTGGLGLFEGLLRYGGLAFVAAHRDDRAACTDLLRAAGTLPRTTGYMRGNAAFLDMARAVDAEQRGGAAAAATVLAGTVAIADGQDLYDRGLWLPDLTRLALAAGDPALARAAVAAAEADAAAEPLARRLAAARQARAVLDGDAAALLAVAAEYRTAQVPLACGQASEEAAVLLATGGDVTGARAALTGAVRAYVALGAAWDVRRADARLRALGVRRGPRAVSRRPTSGWAALTPTELRVVALVAQGRSNPDIAAQMLLSRRTVQTHVSNILAKLGFHSRLEIARESTRRATPDNTRSLTT